LYQQLADLVRTALQYQSSNFKFEPHLDVSSMSIVYPLLHCLQKWIKFSCRIEIDKWL